MNLFLVIPAFNEAKNAPEVVEKALKAGYPVVFVNDGSTDTTLRVLSNFNQPRKKFSLLTHKVNLGKGAAMKTGADYAFAKGADAVIFMDADGQHSIDDLPKFVDKLKQGFSVVLGSRNYQMGVPLIRFLGNKLASVVITLLFGIYVSDLLCGFRGVTKDAYYKMALESSDYAVETEMVIKIKRKNLRHGEVGIDAVYKDKVKGVTILDAINILFEVVRWRLTK